MASLSDLAGHLCTVGIGAEPLVGVSELRVELDSDHVVKYGSHALWCQVHITRPRVRRSWGRCLTKRLTDGLTLDRFRRTVWTSRHVNVLLSATERHRATPAVRASNDS